MGALGQKYPLIHSLPRVRAPAGDVKWDNGMKLAAGIGAGGAEKNWKITLTRLKQWTQLRS